ncbi:MAG: efflux RND transporter periplasmic adaptor subunit [Pirellulales bacterium]|nr:efflux RND transporter periplasmic adaptor subunit [Pirellulales bacterium]
MRRIPLVVVSLITAMAAGATITIGCRRDTADETAAAPLVPVKVCRAKVLTLHPTLDLTGVIVAIPERSATISPQIGGWIKDVLVTESDTVKAGQELIRMDPRIAQINLEKVRASLLENEATLARLRNGYLPKEIDMARAEMAQAKANVGALRGQFDAAKSLHEKHEMSSVQYGKLASELQAAEAAFAAAEAKWKLMASGTRSEDIAKAEAQVAGAKADVNSAELTLQFCTISSPIAGRITRLSAQQGMSAQPAVVLATVTDLSDVFARVRIPNVYQTQVLKQADALVSVGTLPGKEFPGKFARTSGQADVNTGAVDALILVPNQENMLQPGLTCNVRLSLREIKDALVVPVTAIADRDGAHVLTLVRDGKAYEIEVQLGQKAGDLVQITEGVKAGDLVVTEGGYGLPDGCPVKIEQEPPGHEECPQRTR